MNSLCVWRIVYILSWWVKFVLRATDFSLFSLYGSHQMLLKKYVLEKMRRQRLRIANFFLMMFFPSFYWVLLPPYTFVNTLFISALEFCCHMFVCFKVHLDDKKIMQESDSWKKWSEVKWWKENYFPVCVWFTHDFCKKLKIYIFVCPKSCKKDAEKL